MTKREKIGLVALFGVLTLIIIALSISIVLVANIVIVGTSMNVSFVSKEIACKITGSAKYKYDNAETSYTNARVVGSSTTSKTLTFESGVEYDGDYSLDFEQMVIDATGEVIYSFSIENTGLKSICAKVEVGYVDNMNRILTKGEYITDLEGISGYIIHAGQTKSFDLKLTIKDMSLDASATSKITMVLATEFPDDDVTAKVIDQDGTILAAIAGTQGTVQFPTNKRTISIDDNGTTKYFQGYIKSTATSSNLSGYYYGKNYSYSAVTALPSNLVLPYQNVTVASNDVYVAYFDIDPDRSIYSFAVDSDNDGWIISANSSAIFSGTYVLPTLYKGKLITTIGDRAFDQKYSITAIEIPNSVLTISQYAFNSCTGIKSITISNRLETIENYAFYQCQRITDYNLSTSLRTIGDWVFYKNSAITTLVIPEGVTSIGGHCIQDCAALVSVSFPSTVTNFGATPTIDNIKLFTLTVNPNNPIFTSRDEKGNNINAVIEKSSKTLIFGCNGSFIPSFVKSIKSSAFTRQRALASIDIPDGVTSIGESAFSECSALTSLYIPASVTSCNYMITQSCKLLTSLIVDPDNEYYTSRNTSGEECNVIMDRAQKYVRSGCQNSVIPDDAIGLAAASFRYCYLTSIHIPATIKTIGSGTFSGNTTLSSITVDPNNAKYSSRDSSGAECNVLVDKSTNTIIAGCSNSTIPDNVTIIGSGAFQTADIGGSLTIPGTIKTISDNAFYNCISITSITIEEGVESIGLSAFAWCSNLATISVPSTVTSLGVSAFANNAKLKTVTYNTSADIPNTLFQNCKLLSSITIPSGVKTISENAFYGCAALTEITIPSSVNKISRNVFYGCNALTAVAFANPNNWYRTTSATNYNNATGGTLTSLSTPATNKTYFVSTYRTQYWYQAN